MKKILIILLAIAFNVFAQGEGDRIVNPTWKLSSGALSPTVNTWKLSLGSSTTASGSNSVAMGYSTTASGSYSTAMGLWTTASGNNSNAMGYTTTANSYASFAIGRYNVGGGTADSWVATDPLFEIGIGADASNKANAFTVLKNGNVITPLIIGGTATTSDLTLQTTNNTGATGADMHFLVGTNGATEAMTILNDGKVGIGTTGPLAKLHTTVSNSLATGVLFATSDWASLTTGSGLIIKMGAATGDTYSVLQAIKQGANGPSDLILQPTTGNLGLGTTAPLHKLSGYSNTATNLNAFNFINNTINKVTSTVAQAIDTSSFSLNFSSLGSPKLSLKGKTGNSMIYVDSVGVGIGTTSPAQKLTISGGSVMVDNGYGYIAKRNTGGSLITLLKIDSGTDNVVISGAGTSSANSIRFRNTDATDMVTILNNGNVGIGITAPATNLDILTTNDVNGGIRMQSSISNATNKNARIKLGHYLNAEEPVTMLSTTSVNGATLLNIGGGSSVENAVTTISLFTASDGTTVNGTERMTINNLGSVGIKTISPLATFHNNGVAMFGAGTGASLTDSSLIINYSSGSPIVKWYGVDGDLWNLGINTSDAATFVGASGGYSFDNAITMSAGAFTGNAVTRGADAFITTATSDTVTISGAAITDYYTVTLTGTAAPLAADAIRLQKTATGFVLWRSASGTSGLTYDWLSQR